MADFHVRSSENCAMFLAKTTRIQKLNFGYLVESMHKKKLFIFCIRSGHSIGHFEGFEKTAVLS